ncbi:MAG: hypothetical protein ABI551_22565 [Polyangiaceae bacterium]
MRKNKVLLGSGFTIDDVAEACRAAAVELIDGVRDGWGKKELATWLTGPYHQLSILRCSPEELAGPGSDHTPQPPAVIVKVPAEDIVKTMKRARAEALAVLARFAHGDEAPETFVWRVRQKGALARIEDVSGRAGLVPNERPAQLLVERLLSLFAADYVARPLDYEDRVGLCKVCGTVRFDDDIRRTGDCGEHRGSGMRPKLDSSMIEAGFLDPEIEILGEEPMPPPLRLFIRSGP